MKIEPNGVAMPAVTFDRVVAGDGALRGVSLSLGVGLSFVVDVSRGQHRELVSGVAIARLIAGAARPKSGSVRVFGVDPCASPELRRSVALLGDPTLLGGATSGGELTKIVPEIARIRGLSELSTPARVEAFIATLGVEGRGDRLSPSALVALSDRLADAARARVVVMVASSATSTPELSTLARAALARGASVVVVVDRVDRWLHLEPFAGAIATVVGDGVTLGQAPARQLPWSFVTGDTPVRAVLVSWARGNADAFGAIVAAVDDAALVAIERVDPCAVRIRTRDPKSTARALGRLAHAGIELTSLSVEGAVPSEIAAHFRGGAR